MRLPWACRWTKCFDLTKIDRWFLVQIEQIVKIELDMDKLDAEKATAPGQHWMPPRCARSSERASPTAAWPSCCSTTEKAVRDQRRKP